MKILILEDEAMVSMLLEDMVTELGHEVIGPTDTSEIALTLIPSCDFALLDVALKDGDTCFSVAEAMVALDKPFVFSTGHSSLLEGYEHVPVLYKPYSMDHLVLVIPIEPEEPNQQIA